MPALARAQQNPGTPNFVPQVGQQGKDVIWVHGLFGEDQPDVAQLVREQCGDCAGVANFRVSVAGSFHDWLLTHLTLGFVRLKTVTIRGEKLTRKA